MLGNEGDKKDEKQWCLFLCNEANKTRHSNRIKTESVWENEIKKILCSRWLETDPSQERFIFIARVLRRQLSFCKKFTFILLSF